MPNPEHLDILKQGVSHWNQWRSADPSVMPDLRGSMLPGGDYCGTNFQDCILSGADLSRANLQEVSLARADLRGVLLTGADLRGADLRCAVLGDLPDGHGNALVDITGADFTGALFGWTFIGDIFLTRIVGVGTIRHVGPSYVATSTLEFTVEELAKNRVIRSDVERFLRGAGVLLDSFKLYEESLRSNNYYSAFISFSHADADFALWLHEKLQQAGVRCWLDDKNMVRGTRILDAVGKAISSHDKVLVCCSKSSLNSWWVHDEIRKAQDLERRSKALRIIPVLIDRYLLDEWDDGLASDLTSRLAVNFAGWKPGNRYETELQRLLRALQKMMEGAGAS